MQGTSKRFRFRLGWSLAALGLLAACEQAPTSPAAVPPGDRPFQEQPSYFTDGSGARSLLLADSQSLTEPKQEIQVTGWDLGGINSRSPGVDTVKIAAPNGDSITVRRFGPNTKKTIVVGQDTFVFQVVVWENGSGTGGDFMGLLYKNGKLIGFFGHCTLMENTLAVVTDTTGKQTIHWFNSSKDSTRTFHYAYDPATNRLIITEIKDGKSTVIYDGPPLTDPKNRPGTSTWVGPAPKAPAQPDTVRPGGGGQAPPEEEEDTLFLWEHEDSVLTGFGAPATGGFEVYRAALFEGEAPLLRRREPAGAR